MDSRSRVAKRPRFANMSLESRGSRECRVHAAPAVSCAKMLKRKAHTSIQVQRKHSGIPCAMVLRLMPCSPRRRIRLVTVIDGLTVCLTRLGQQNPRRFDTSNGCQDHTVLPYAIASFVCALLDRSQATPALRSSRAPTLPRPPHPLPRS